MAHVPQEQIDAAYEAMLTGFDLRGKTYRWNPIWKEGFSSGYTLGEDAGFDRGWHAAEWECRPWWLKILHKIAGMKYREQRRFI